MSIPYTPSVDGKGEGVAAAPHRPLLPEGAGAIDAASAVGNRPLVGEGVAIRRDGGKPSRSRPPAVSL